MAVAEIIGVKYVEAAVAVKIEDDRGGFAAHGAIPGKAAVNEGDFIFELESAGSSAQVGDGMQRLQLQGDLIAAIIDAGRKLHTEIEAGIGGLAWQQLWYHQRVAQKLRSGWQAAEGGGHVVGRGPILMVADHGVDADDLAGIDGAVAVALHIVDSVAFQAEQGQGGVRQFDLDGRIAK